MQRRSSARPRVTQPCMPQTAHQILCPSMAWPAGPLGRRSVWTSCFASSDALEAALLTADWTPPRTAVHDRAVPIASMLCVVHYLAPSPGASGAVRMAVADIATASTPPQSSPAHLTRSFSSGAKSGIDQSTADVLSVSLLTFQSAGAGQLACIMR